LEGGAGVRSARRACGRAGAPDRLDARQVAAVAARPAICIVPVPGGADTPPSARSETDAPLCGRWFGLGTLGGDATQHRGECWEGSAGRVLCIPRALAYEGVCGCLGACCGLADQHVGPTTRWRDRWRVVHGVQALHARHCMRGAGNSKCDAECGLAAPPEKKRRNTSAPHDARAFRVPGLRVESRCEWCGRGWVRLDPSRMNGNVPRRASPRPCGAISAVCGGRTGCRVEKHLARATGHAVLYNAVSRLGDTRRVAVARLRIADHLLVAAALLGHVALRALGLEDLSALLGVASGSVCERSRHGGCRAGLMIIDRQRLTRGPRES